MIAARRWWNRFRTLRGRDLDLVERANAAVLSAPEYQKSRPRPGRSTDAFSADGEGAAGSGEGLNQEVVKLLAAEGGRATCRAAPKLKNTPIRAEDFPSSPERWGGLCRLVGFGPGTMASKLWHTVVRDGVSGVVRQGPWERAVKELAGAGVSASGESLAATVEGRDVRKTALLLEAGLHRGSAIPRAALRWVSRSKTRMFSALNLSMPGLT